MSCIVRFSGKNLNVDALSEKVGLPVDRLWQRGERKFPKSTKNFSVNENSGVNYIASNADFGSLSNQIEDALKFCIDNNEKLILATNFPGVEFAVIDFGVEIKSPWYYWYTFPSKLLTVVSAAGLALCVSPYPVFEDEE